MSEMWEGRVIDHPTHPWCSDGQHAISRRMAHKIAVDLVHRERWVVGANLPVPVYDPSDGQYVGDDSDDRVKCQTHLLRIHAPGHTWEALSEPALCSDHVTGMSEIVYRALHAADLARAGALREEIRRMQASGWQADEDPTDTLRRLVANGYTVQTLRAQIHHDLSLRG